MGSVSRIDAGHQAGDHVIVEGNGEGQQRGGDDAGQQRGQRDVPECLPLVGAEIEAASSSVGLTVRSRAMTTITT